MERGVGIPERLPWLYQNKWRGPGLVTPFSNPSFLIYIMKDLEGNEPKVPKFYNFMNLEK